MLLSRIKMDCCGFCPKESVFVKCILLLVFLNQRNNFVCGDEAANHHMESDIAKHFRCYQGEFTSITGGGKVFTDFGSFVIRVALKLMHSGGTRLWFLSSDETRAGKRRQVFVVLLDTRTATSDLGWVTSPGSKWYEMSGQHPDDDGRRILGVCEIRSPGQNNWIRTPFIPSEGAHRIHVEFEFTIRSCEGISQVATCKETFNLYYYETDRDEATTTFPPWSDEAYRKVDTVAADRRFHQGTEETNFEIVTIGPLRRSGLYIAIQDNGACLAIMHLRVYYKYCPPITTNLARFPRTKAGPEPTSIVLAEGVCIEYAVFEEENVPIFYCNSDGSWVVPKGKCRCDSGFYPNPELSRCQACQKQSYKPHAGNGPCFLCPPYSLSAHLGASVCECMNGYYRALSDSATTPCTKPPSKPLDLRADMKEPVLTLSWIRPYNDGGREDLYYWVECFECHPNFTSCTICPQSIDFSPSQHSIQVTSIEVKGIKPETYYKFIVYAGNGVSDVSYNEQLEEPNYATISLVTSPIKLPKVTGVVISNITMNSFQVSWRRPIIPKERLQQQYWVVIFDELQNELMSIKTINTSVKVEKLSFNKTYIIKVKLGDVYGFGPYSDFKRIITKSADSDKSLDDETEEPIVFLLPLIGVLVGVMIIIFCILAVLFFTRKSRRFPKKTQNAFDKHPLFNTATLLAPGVFTNSLKTYVDPTTYGNPQRALIDFTKELSISCISIETTIGGGEFGDVCRGYVQSSINNVEKKSVAIKTLKSGYTEEQRMSFLTEASIMGQFDHPNVIRLEGVVTKTCPVMIITEFMENGALDGFLRKHDGQLSVYQLVRILRDIASGMKYLSDMGYVHRDLAARNILVNSELVCKVSDFGLSRVLEEDGDATYTTRGGKIPIRWTAPEAITHRKFTSASDVWSFGIVIWEVMSYGERPYWGMSNRDVVAAIETGYRLPAPMECPLLLHHLMLDCWKKDRNERPKFSSILVFMDQVLQNPDELKQTSNPSFKSQSLSRIAIELNSSPSTLPAQLRRQNDSYLCGSHRSLVDDFPLGCWLEKIGLRKYKENFAQNGYIRMEQILQIKPSDLEKVGVSNGKHQDLILNSLYLMTMGSWRKSKLLDNRDDNLDSVSI